MWDGAINWGVVREDLIIGSCPRAGADLERIRDEAGATAVLSLQTDGDYAEHRIDLSELGRQAAALGLELARAPLRDFDPVDQRARLIEAVVALHRLIAAGQRVYVHCTAGINRSSLTVLGYLCFVEGLAPGAALSLIRRGRPQAKPYLDVLVDVAAELTAERAPQIAARATELEAAGRTPSEARMIAERQLIRGGFDARLG